MIDKKPTISVVIPVYNSEKSLPDLLTALTDELHKITSVYEIILINDGSKDDSWEVINSLITKYKHVCAINLMRNFGQHNALLCGIRQANYDLIVTLDDDLQHDPALISVLIGKLNEGYEVVYGAPLA